MSVCVVGGTGFIGRHLCEALHRTGISAVTTSRAPDHAFLNLHAPSIRGISLDDPELWHEIARAQAIVYLGSSTKPGLNWRAPDHEIGIDVASMARFVRRAFDVNPSCHVVYASSGGAIYGGQYNSPIREDKDVFPATAYALGKHLSEQTLRFYTYIDRHHVSVLRIANPVGRWQNGSRHGLVSAAVRASLSADEITIYGEGQNVRDYFDADELAELMVKVALESRGGFRVYNVGSGVGHTELEILALVQETLGQPIKYQFRPARPFDTQYAVICAKKIFCDYGWETSLSLQQTIRKLVS